MARRTRIDVIVESQPVGGLVYLPLVFAMRNIFALLSIANSREVLGFLLAHPFNT